MPESDRRDLHPYHTESSALWLETLCTGFYRDSRSNESHTLSPCSCNGTLEGDFRLFRVELQILIQLGSDRLVFGTPVSLAWGYPLKSARLSVLVLFLDLES
ncbi:hypothetical protein [Microcoleus sp. LAD1_D3]|uniref:hypothetical protein n=1 Tax=Microcoleus sp. LAD1_D3 TaxID=2819365 RepID=UPI002FD3916E